MRSIGTGSGASGGLVTQMFARDKKIKVLAETERTFRHDRTLLLSPKSQLRRPLAWAIQLVIQA
jgi:hypothetical protein